MTIRVTVGGAEEQPQAAAKKDVMLAMELEIQGNQYT